jgi:hypothetical protein
MGNPVRNVLAAAGLISLSAAFTQAAAQDVYARPDLLDEYSVAVPHLSKWAGMPVVIMTPDDLPPKIVAAALALKKDYDNWRSTKPPGWTDADLAKNDAYKNEGKLIALSAARPFRQAFHKLTGEHFKGDAADAFADMMTGEAYAVTVQDRRGVNYCMIRAPGPDWDTPQRIFSIVADLKPNLNAISGATGTLQDWLTIIMAHEAAHCRLHGSNEARRTLPDWAAEGHASHKVNYTEGGLAREIEADRAAFAEYRALALTDNRLDLQSLKHFQAARAISSLLLHGRRGNSFIEGHRHATSIAVSPDGATPAWSGNPDKFSDMTAILDSLDMPAMLSTLLIAHVMAPAADDTPVTVPTILCAYPIPEVFTACSKGSYETAGQKIRDHYYDARLFGNAEAVRNPAVRVAALTALQETGIFKSNPMTKAYVDQFLTAVGIYAPSLADPVLIDRFRAAFAADRALLNRLVADVPYALKSSKDCPDGYPRPSWKPGPDCQ